jgi:hypothetical protein
VRLQNADHRNTGAPRELMCSRKLLPCNSVLGAGVGLPNVYCGRSALLRFSCSAVAGDASRSTAPYDQAGASSSPRR